MSAKESKSSKKSAKPSRAKRSASRALRDEVCEANIELFRRGLARFTFGNASGVDRDQGLIVIKPSGVPYNRLTPAKLVVTDMDGVVVQGDLRPSSDLPTHAVLLRAYPTIGGVVHTHSMYATVFAQAQREIPCLGTTHADYFYGAVPVTTPLSEKEIAVDYERNTGEAIVRRFAELDVMSMPAVLVASHASFCWGTSVAAAVENASYLEEIATMAYHTLCLKAKTAPIPQALLDKHFLRKHGSNAYYGQKR